MSRFVLQMPSAGKGKKVVPRISNRQKKKGEKERKGGRTVIIPSKGFGRGLGRERGGGKKGKTKKPNGIKKGERGGGDNLIV